MLLLLLAHTSRCEPCKSLSGSLATTPLVDFHHRRTACPSYSERTAPGKECCPFVLLHTSGQLGPRSVLPIFVVMRRLLNSAEVKDFIKLNEHLMNVLCMEPTVFHGFDNIASTSVVAPFLIHGQDLLSYKAGGADAICLACHKTTVFSSASPLDCAANRSE